MVTCVPFPYLHCLYYCTTWPGIKPRPGAGADRTLLFSAWSGCASAHSSSDSFFIMPSTSTKSPSTSSANETLSGLLTDKEKAALRDLCPKSHQAALDRSFKFRRCNDQERRETRRAWLRILDAAKEESLRVKRLIVSGGDKAVNVPHLELGSLAKGLLELRGAEGFEDKKETKTKAVSKSRSRSKEKKSKTVSKSRSRSGSGTSRSASRKSSVSSRTPSPSVSRGASPSPSRRASPSPRRSPTPRPSTRKSASETGRGRSRSAKRETTPRDRSPSPKPAPKKRNIDLLALTSPVPHGWLSIKVSGSKVASLGESLFVCFVQLM